MSGPPLPEWTHSTGARQADENGSACAQEIFSQDNKLLAQLLTVPSAAGNAELGALAVSLAAHRPVAAAPRAGQGAGIPAAKGHRAEDRDERIQQRQCGCAGTNQDLPAAGPNNG